MKKAISLLMALILIAALFAACGDGGSTSSPSSAPTASAASTQSPEGGEQLPYPVMDVPTQFSIWSPVQSQQASVLTDFNDISAFQEIERLTNIHISWIHPATGNEREVFNMLIASQNYPDAINHFSSYYTRGLDNAVKEDIALELTDIIGRFMPDYSDKVDLHEEVQKNTRTDAGLTVQLYCLYQTRQAPWYGLTLRKDWLDDLNLGMPETYDDWYRMLKSFKEVKGATEPMLLYNLGDTPDGHFAGGFGVKNAFINADGTVKYGPLEEGYKEYLQTMAQWYREELIDRDFNTRSDPYFIPDTSFVFTGRSGVWAGSPQSYGTDAYNVYGLTEDPSFEGAGVRNPVKNSGEVTHFRTTSQLMGTGLVITQGCADVETLAKWFNFNYTELGATITNFGIEGKTFTYVDGVPMLSKALSEETFGDDWARIGQKRGPIEFPFYRAMNDVIPMSDYEQFNEATKEARVQYAADQNDWAISTYASPTSEETSEIALIMGDIETLVAEKTIRYILGVDSFDTYESDFIGLIKSMNIDRAIELTQQYVTRYEHR